MVLTKDKVDFYEERIPGCFPAIEWVFQDVRSVASEDKSLLRKIAKDVWKRDPNRYDFSAILLADVRELHINGRKIYYGSSIACSQRLC